MWRRIGLLLALLVVAGGARAQVPGEDPTRDKNLATPPAAVTPALPIEKQGTGAGLERDLSAGDEAPDFSLESSQGGTVRLGDLKGHWVVLAFTDDYRLLGPYKAIDDDLRKAGVRLYGVSQDGASTLKSFAAQGKIPFVILSDPSTQISQTFGMYDDGRDEIQPGIVILDPKGTVQLTLHGQSLHRDELLQLVRHSVLGA
jgi:thioredoxin-dependent peroxiredoxin